jgi:hypothetical protein
MEKMEDEKGLARSMTEAKKSRMDALKSAKKRAEEIRQHGGDLEDGTDDFWVDTSTIPEGWSYEWKRFTVWGQEDPSYQVGLRRAGWEPVPASRHPEMMPVGYSGEDIILRKGMILMERPQEITDEIRAKDRKEARDAVRAKEAQLNDAPAGQFERSNKECASG